MNRNLQTRMLLFLFSVTLLVGQADSQIDQSSITSLKVKIFRNNAEIGSATGFVVDKNNKHYLVTNRHVVLACAQDGDPAKAPPLFPLEEIEKAADHSRVSNKSSKLASETGIVSGSARAERASSRSRNAASCSRWITSARRSISRCASARFRPWFMRFRLRIFDLLGIPKLYSFARDC
jgi:hypothetical protein